MLRAFGFLSKDLRLPIESSRIFLRFLGGKSVTDHMNEYTVLTSPGPEPMLLPE